MRLFRTLLADQDGLYDPTDYNDRLLLGLKGTMSEAELHILRGRMYQGLLNKAKRGEVFNHAPIGYVKQLTGEFALDPDEQVQSVVRLVFDEFERQGTLHGLLRYSGASWHSSADPTTQWTQAWPTRMASSQSGDAAKPAASSAVRGLLLLGPSRHGPASQSGRPPGDRTHQSPTARLSGLVAGSLSGLHHGRALLGQSKTSGGQPRGQCGRSASRSFFAGWSARLRSVWSTPDGQLRQWRKRGAL